MSNLGRPRPPMRMRANVMQMPSMANLQLRQPMPARPMPMQPGLALPQLPQLPQVPQPPMLGQGGGDRVGSGGRLSAAQRRALPDSAFAGPNRTYPVEDKGHAQFALAELHNAPRSAQAHIRARAERALGHGGGNFSQVGSGPLMQSGSRGAVGQNIRTEIGAGKPQRQAVAIALDVQRRNGGGRPY